MHDPQVLARILRRLTPGKAALVVVDVQNDYCHEEGVFGRRGFDLSGVREAVRRLSALVRRCRELAVPVVFARTTHSEWTDSAAWLGRLEGAAEEMRICRAGSWGAEFYEVAPAAEEFVVTKHRFSAFVNTDLDLVLRSRGITTLFLAGVTTNVCVETTLRDAFNRDYSVVLAEDCCAAFSPEEHAATVVNVNRYFGAALGAEALLEAVEPLFRPVPGASA